ncbi:hypothetical protein AB0392_41005 [Nonomuraea angiospora]|uniref:hypothetical protein n=1 Tax=Nonomuraea angiospora TaxID=46172 RepID=UPI00344DCE7D
MSRTAPVMKERAGTGEKRDARGDLLGTAEKPHGVQAALHVGVRAVSRIRVGLDGTGLHDVDRDPRGTRSRAAALL